MRNLEKARKEARAVLNRKYDITVIEYMQKLLIENAAEKITACPSCGSGELSKDDRFIVCDKCGAGGYFKVFDGGDVRLFWEKDRKEYRQ